MKQFNRLHLVKNMKPKKQTIDFILAYSRSYASIAGSEGKKYMICKN